MSLMYAGRFGGLKQRFKRGRMSTYHGFFDPWSAKHVDCRTEAVARLWLLRRVDLATRDIDIRPAPFVFRGPLARESLQCDLRTTRIDGSNLYEVLEPRAAEARAILATRLAEAARQNGCFGRMVTAEELRSLDIHIRNALWMRQLLTMWFDHDLRPVEAAVLAALQQGPMSRGEVVARCATHLGPDGQRVDVAVVRLRGRGLVRFNLERQYGDETVLRAEDTVASHELALLQAKDLTRESRTEAALGPKALVP